MGESLRNLHARALLLPLILLGCGDKGTGSGTGSSDVGSGSTSVGTSGSGSVTGTSDSMPTSGSSSASGTTGDAVVPCTVDADCMKVEDCCTCAAIEAGDPPGACKVMCDQSACAAVGLQDTIAECRSGHCELSSTVECSKPVACDQAPPVCESGMVPSIDGDCYGPCVSYHYCNDTAACKASCGEGWTCVTSQSGAGGGCFPLPTACGGVATCACVDAYWDSACPASCTESEGGLLCVDGG
jgi:hypothetical protein